MAFPCKNCIERHTDCWSACPKYQAEKEKSQAVKVSDKYAKE